MNSNSGEHSTDASRHDRVLDTLSSELLGEIAAGLAHSVTSTTIRPGHERRWEYLIEAENYEAIVIAWPAGTGLRMHDHAGSLAALHIVSGRLRERYLASDGSVQTRWLEAGDAAELPADHTHEMVNLGDTEAISIHVYSPRLSDVAFRDDGEIVLEHTD